jgi:hypothetical protein
MFALWSLCVVVGVVVVGSGQYDQEHNEINIRT